MMDLQCAVTVQEGAGDDDNSKDPVVALSAAAPTAPFLPGLLIVKPFPFAPSPMENQAVAMSNAGSTETLPSSPAEASLAKLATASPTNTTTVTANGTDVDKSPTTSDIVSVSYTLASAATRLAETPTTPPPPPPTTNSTTPPLATPPIRVVAVAVVEKKAAPAVLHFKGISVTLENNSVWRQFDAFRTEMILTKTGRRMFPYCRYRISGLVPDQRYNLVLSIVPADQYKYRWNTKKWEVIGSAEHQAPGLIRAFSHPNSPCLGSEWMRNLVSFYKLKLTNNVHDTEGHMVLHSMHRYIPRLHIIPVLDGNGPTADQPVIKGPESMTFTFPQTSFVSVTTYQNPWIIKLKINHNPFAKGFREDGFHPRQGKVKLKTEGSEGKNDTKPASNSSSMEIDPQETCTKKPTAASPDGDAWETESHGEQPEASEAIDYSMDMFGEMDVSTEGMTPNPSPDPSPPPKGSASVKVEPSLPPNEEAEPSSPPNEEAEPSSPPNEEAEPSSPPKEQAEPSLPPKRPRGRPPKRRILSMSPTGGPTTPSGGRVNGEAWSSRRASAPVKLEPEDSGEDYLITPTHPKKKKRANRKWGNSRGRADGKLGGAAAPAVMGAVSSPASAVTLQPETDDVEGLLFVSFTSQEALGLHVGDRATGNTRSSPAQESPVSRLMPSNQNGVSPETEERSFTRLQGVLLDDLGAQVIHPHLKEGVRLHLPPPDLPGRGNTTPLSPTVGGSAFVSRTGKTSDLTKIKGWRDKFIRRSKEPSSASPPQQDASQKDLSAFCSNMLDEYLESEAQQISERAAAFSAAAEGSVTYQLPEKSASYVKTLDSALKQRRPAPPPPPKPATHKAARPFPLAHKPLLYSALTSPAPPLAQDKPEAPRTKSAATEKAPRAKSAAAEKAPRAKSAAAEKAPRAKSAVAEKAPRAKSAAVEKAPRAKSPRSKPAAPQTAQQDQATKSPKGGQTTPHPISLWFPADKSPQGPTTPGPQCSSPSGPGQKAGSPGWASLHFKGLTKLQLKMLRLEETSENQGAQRTSLTPSRVDFALSALLTASMQPKVQWVTTQYKAVAGPDCGQAFCRLGCVCSSLARLNRGPLHCRRPDCMLGCDCFKRKITKQLLEGGCVEDEVHQPAQSQSQSLYAVTSLQHAIQPSPGAHWDRIWHKSKAPPDPEPVHAPEGTERLHYNTRRTVHPKGKPIQEKDKDPVYKYLESFMTCARIREFRPLAKDPPKTSAKGSASSDGSRASPGAIGRLAPTLSLHTQPAKPNAPAKKFPSIILTFENTGKTTMDKDSLDSTQIEVLSECHWDDDRKLILGALCQHMKRGSLATPFCAGPYHIALVAKILRPRPNGSTIRYRMRVTKPTPASEEEEEEEEEDDAEDSSDEEDIDENDSDDGEIRSLSEEEEEEEEAVKQHPGTEHPCSPGTDVLVGVTPFQSRVVPAGFLQARKKPSGSDVLGLVQVNGRSYPRACLMLGRVGSLHPANRLAAYVTGRLPSNILPQKARVPGPQGNAQPTQGVKTASTLKNKAGVESDGAHKCDPSPPAAHLPPQLKSFTAGWRGTAAASPCSTSYSSPVSITVSRALKEPSFLAERGTFSFRICPPVTNQQGGASTTTAAATAAAGHAQNLAGVTLPGGFTLIQLPKHGAKEALALPVDLNKFPTAGSISSGGSEIIVTEEASPPPLSPLPHVKEEDPATAVVPEPGSSSPGLRCDPDRPPEDETSEEGCSDSDRDEEDGDGDASADDGSFVDIETVDEESVDIETVEDLTKTIEQLRANSRSICDSGEESGSSMESKSKQQARPPRAQEGVKEEVKMELDENEDAVDMMSGCRRRQHKVLERLRRSEQRYLFTRLQTILRTDPKAPKLRLLSQANSEIQNLVETSKSLELQKKRLSDMQMLYIRRISCLAGKTEEVIRRKLKEVYERKQLPQAQRKSPFSLYKVPQVDVRGKATPLRPPQAPPVSPAPAPKAPTPSLTPAQNQQPEPHPKPPAEPIASPQSTSLVAESQDIGSQDIGSSSLPRPRRTAPPRVSPKRRVKYEDCSPEITTNAHSPETKPQVKILPTGAAAEPPPPPPAAAAAGSQPMTLPLIRTKTGRIILPSSLRPIGQGFYTITIMEPDKEKANSPADQASKPAAGQSSEDGVPGGEEEPDSSTPVAAEDAGESSPSPTSPEPLQKPKLSPLVEIARLNKSIVSLPSGKPLLLRSTNAAGENNGTSRLSFSPCSLVYVPLVQEPAKAERVQGQEGEAEPSPTAPRRGPGRPRKSPAVTPAGQNADDAGLSEGSTTEAQRSPPAAAAAAATAAAGAGAGGGRGGSSKKAAVAASPVPVKRGPGRPRKRPLEADNRGRGPKVKQAAHTPVSQGQRRPVRNVRKSPEEARPTRAISSPAVNRSGGEGSAKRPLTRGSLGKDFPSAKRMSWLDMEKELELD